MNLRELIDAVRDEGYTQANAEARVCQDTRIVPCLAKRSEYQSADMAWSPPRFLSAARCNGVADEIGAGACP